MTPPEKTIGEPSNSIEGAPNPDEQIHNPPTPQITPSLTFQASPELTNQSMQEAGVCLQKFLEIMGGRMTPTAPFVPATETRGIVAPSQGVVVTPDTRLEISIQN